MKIHTVSSLDTDMKNRVRALVDLCCKKEGLSLSLPLDDADLYALYEGNGQLISAAAFTRVDQDIYECAAFTAPKMRNRRLFSGLLDEAMAILPEESEFLFCTDNHCPDTAAVLSSMEAEHISDEFMMELSLKDYIPEHLPHPAPGSLTVRVTETSEDGIPTLHYSAAQGSVMISVFASHYYLYGFEIRKADRGKGLGTAFLSFVLHDLASREPLPVTLQVSGDNSAALSLYKKTGFRITEILSCYLY